MENTTTMRITRARVLGAMQTLIITMGGVTGYAAWLKAMPADAALSVGGCVEQYTLLAIAADDVAYTKAVKAFASVITPVLAAL